MKKVALHTLLICSLCSEFGCESSSPYRGRLASYAPDAGYHDFWDAAFRRRHRDLKEPIHGDPMLEVARDLTLLEDDIRRDGSITVKKPDVWGDGNLIASIQEYEHLMALSDHTAFDKRFSESVQAYIARSQLLVNGHAQFHYVSPLFGGVGFCDAGGFVNAGHAHVVGKFNLGLVHAAFNGCSA